MSESLGSDAVTTTTADTTGARTAVFAAENEAANIGDDVADAVLTRAIAGEPSWMQHSDGHRSELPTGRWMGGTWSTPQDRAFDEVILDACSGPTLDLGCGPGRFTAALTRFGTQAVGMDTCAAAVAMTRARGGCAVESDVLGPLPAAGRWSTVLLADGNVGIGGNLSLMLEQVADALEVGGRAVIEVDAPGTGHHYHRRRWHTDTIIGPWFPWVSVDADSLAAHAPAVRLQFTDHLSVGARHLVFATRH
ncbi:class I SAM-dependent methyltransferase [Rhodococcus sp. G-MC3]|uniref:class I SAM-dependent methyltransferase n=1 Tax=Rhodococcus sp. G-MC3 TaxID=3046209 RepID=UPI0024BB8B44|nr:class I SAM-dependent methyltransferase [Rhodococcus sp. G-MC3]MDJ0392469.1 class I SAM-dependent methyltransferase [Rhodococcus sp. G-MC3]